MVSIYGKWSGRHSVLRVAVGVALSLQAAMWHCCGRVRAAVAVPVLASCAVCEGRSFPGNTAAGCLGLGQ